MIALLLHHHQPDYRDPATGVPVMPWVRLHATRGYTDVAEAIRQTGGAATVNLVPSLLDQLDHYAAGGSDVHLDLARRPTDSLEPAERRFVADHFFHGTPASFTWFPAWGALRARRHALDLAALRDVIVWSNLAWFGWTACARHPELLDLRAKGHGFTEADKDFVLQVQRSMLQALRHAHQGLPEVSATPYAHPILPLLVDTGHARRNLPLPEDPGLRAPEDALRQLRDGKARVEAWIGEPVAGLWPSEGSVSPEVAALAREAGFRWMATDEEVLRRSGGGPPDAPYLHDGMRMVFRDHENSDRIGFLYQSWDGAAAAKDLLARVQRPTLLALDGENPWEAYRDAGRAFLLQLLGSRKTQTVGAFAEGPARTLPRLHTGSWIGADFRIWIGHEDDVAAWRLLRDARDAWVEAGRPESAWPALRSAEGSDWFWWYGPEFSTPFQDAFDRLFRAHLRAVWTAIGRTPPPALDRPVVVRAPSGRTPRGALGAGGWFAVAGAGHVELRAGAMAPSAAMPERFCWGRKGDAVAMWVEPRMPGWSWVDEAGETPLPATRPSLRDGWLQGPNGLRIPEAGTWTLHADPPERPD